MESQLDTPQGSWRRVEWAYDALGRRVRQTTSFWTNNAWQVIEDLKFVSDPMLFGRHIAELNATNNALIRSYVWGLDLSGTMDGAGGVGGLLWVNQHAGSSAGTHFCAYDGNGNVVALVSANTGTETARYEYGPFGEPLRITGPMSKENPFRFSTKRTCNTTDLVLYEYRAYNPSLGRWVSRDPVEGSHEFAFVDNTSVSSIDVLGLWDTDVHRDKTAAWASALGIHPKAAHKIGVVDDNIDDEFTTYSFTEENWSWHFDRSEGGEDSRIIKARGCFEKAKWWCTWNESVRNDEWARAAAELGRMLHPLQDWVAHGDFNRRAETPNMPKASIWRWRKYVHNILSPVRGQGRKTPDDPKFDSFGIYGRPTLTYMVLGAELDYGGSKDKLYWAWFFQGSQRINATEALTKLWLGEFQEYVRKNSRYCGACWRFFVP